MGSDPRQALLEIRPAQALDAFVSCDAVQLWCSRLRQLALAPQCNASWLQALSAVRAVYLITDRRSGRMAVGSARGQEGLWGRWRDYAQTGHGGSLALQDLDPQSFEFSLLEMGSRSLSAEDLLTREDRWKRPLATRQFGLNQNGVPS